METITAGDSLKAIFQAAVEWNAILLLDEADVVQSRIQIALQFDEMNVRTRRKIWERFIKLIKTEKLKMSLRKRWTTSRT